MNCKKIVNSELFYPIILVIIAIITHLPWFNSQTILSYGDHWHWTNTMVKEALQTHLAWTHLDQFGSINPILSNSVFTVLFSLLGNFGLSSDMAMKILLLIPCALLGFLAPYFLIRRLINNRFISLVCALYYGSTTYFLVKQTNHISLAFGYAIAPLVVLFFLTALERNKIRNWLCFILCFNISIIYEVRITYITAIICLLYFVLIKIRSLKKYLVNASIAFIFILLLNLYWILPLVSPVVSIGIKSIANRGVWGSHLFDMAHALALSESSWTGSMPNPSFIKEKIHWYFWLIPLLAAVPFVFFSKFEGKGKRNIFFFGVILAIGIFLTKQSAHPFSSLYKLIYRYIPGFGLFREASKFYGLTALGYTAVLAYSLSFFQGLKEKKYFLITSLVVILIALTNLKPLVTGEINGLFKPRTIPLDYMQLEKHLLEDKRFYRTLSIPQYTRWIPYTRTHPAISAENTIIYNWSDLADYTEGSLLNKENYLRLFNQPYSNNLLDIASIKYIIVPSNTRDDDDIFSFRSRNREYFINNLSKQKYLSKINLSNIKNVVIFENFHFKPLIYQTDEKETITKTVPFTELDYQGNSAKYSVNANTNSKPFYLNFSDAYNPGWTVLGNNRYLDDKYHFENEAGFNSFLIHPQELCNADNTCQLTLLFKPQLNFEIGSYISLISLAIFLLILFFYRYEKK